MNNISMNQALEVWGQLWMAYYGNHPYGSDTAEIYAYLLTPCEPVLSMPAGKMEDRKLEFGRNSAKSLRSLIEKFYNENKDFIDIEIDGLP